MKSGLEGRNNSVKFPPGSGGFSSLNEVRPGRPEQCDEGFVIEVDGVFVSMKSGLEGRNNSDVYDITDTRLEESQ